MSEMSGLQIALSALYAQQRGLEVTGENIANANTQGYSKQAVNLQEIGGPSTPAFAARFSGTGSGVQVVNIDRYRDQFLEISAALEHGASGQLDQLKSAYANLEQVFQEPSDTGLQEQMAQLWSGFDDLANNPGDGASRTQLLEQAKTLAASFNAAATSIKQMSSATVAQIQASVTDVNTKAGTIAQLNDAIKSRVVAGLNANDLMDQRDLLANQLATEVGATIRQGDNGQVNLSIGGTPLVFANRSESLVADTSQPQVVVRWQKDNFPATITGGQIGGMLQTVNQLAPQYMAGIDAVATQLRDQVNAMQSNVGGQLDIASQDQSANGNLQFQVALNGGGYQTVTVAGADWSGAGGAAALQTTLQTAMDGAVGAGNSTVTVTGGAGQPMSISVVPTGTNKLLVQATPNNNGLATLLGQTAIGLDGIGGRAFFSGTGAADLAVSSDIANNANGIAAGVAANGPLDNSVALQAAELGSSTTGADAQYRAFVVGLGVQSQSVQQRAAIQTQTTSQVDNQRSGISGVSTDEEMVNLMQFQRAYEASARVMNAINEVLDKLINQTG
jgi:flagellar hook-associated protein 1 FlgK